MTEPFQHLQAVLDESRPLAQRFVDQNHRVYLVGGIVRDLWLNRPLGDELDIDLTTDAVPKVIKELLRHGVDALWTQGERFGTIGAQLQGRAYEITTHRSETYHSDSRKPKVTFSTAVEEDLSRRDFTVNAMAMSLPDATLIDPYGGADDLANSVLRTPLAPEISFEDDPLRMLRAARFSAGYALIPQPELLQAMTNLAARLDIVSAERVRDELDKLLLVKEPSTGLDLLQHTDLLPRFLPEVGQMAEGIRHELLAAVDAVQAPSPELLRQRRLTMLLMGATLFAEPGVVATAEYQAVSSRRCKALRHATERTRWTSLVGTAALQVANGVVVDAPSVRQWWSNAKGHAPEGLELARVLTQPFSPGSGTAGGARVDLGLVNATAGLVTELATDLADLSVPLTGDEVMAQLQCEPGRIVGQALEYLRSVRFAQGPITRDQAIDELSTWWKRKNA